MSKFDTHGELNELVAVYDSNAFRLFLEERKQFLQSEVNKFVKQKDITEAYATLGKLEDITKTMDMLNKRIFELRKEQ